MIRFFLFLILFVNIHTANSMTITINTEDYPPFNLFNEVTGEIEGVATGVVKEIMKRTGLEYELNFLPWQRAYQEALNEKDACVYSTARTKERENLFHWVGPLITSHWVLFARSDSDIKIDKLEDAKKYVIGGYLGDATSQHLEKLGFKVDNSYEDKFNAVKLVNNRIDLWATSDISGRYLAQKQNIKNIKIIHKFNEIGVYLACNTGLKYFWIKKLQDTLESLKSEKFMHYRYIDNN